jgi:hypothetical protein
MAETELDRSDAADAERFRWLVAGNSYLLEEFGVGDHKGEEDDCRRLIDEWMQKHPFRCGQELESPRVVTIGPAPPRALSEEERQEIREQAAALGVPPPDIAIG